MPKMKTNSSAKKRFKVRGSGSIVKRSSNRAHILTKKDNKRKRQLRGLSAVLKCDMTAVKRMLRIE